MRVEELINSIFDIREPKQYVASKVMTGGFDMLDIADTLFSHKFRDLHCQHSFPILDEGNVKIIVDLIQKHIPNPVGVEVMSGKGWLSYWLKRSGIEVMAITDNKTWKGFDWKLPTPVPIFNMDCVDAVKEFQLQGANLVIMSWPYMNDNAFKVLKVMKKGTWLLYIGESESGCTADDDFFEFAYKHCEWFASEEYFKQFHGIHDEPGLILKK